MSNSTQNTAVYKGNVVYTPTPEKFEIVENGYIIVEGERIKGVFKFVPEEYKTVFVEDYGNKLIIPGFVDMHFHAPQLANRGLGFDLPLLEWLRVHTFKEEAKFSDLKYASVIYHEVAKQLIRNGTTRVSLLGTIHKDATLLLIDIIANSGLGAYIGKVNMDANSPEYLQENTWQSLQDIEEIIIRTMGKYKYVKPMIIPRFAPACTEQLMQGLGILAKRYGVPVHSHLAEDPDELEFVKKEFPQFKNYADVYNHFGLFGQEPTIMAHCVYVNDEEMELMARNRVYAAHCPITNFNLSGSVAPIRKFLDKGIPVGLGTDVAAGHSVSIKDVMWQAVQASKVIAQNTNNQRNRLKTEEVFYLGTKGGGSFFGKVGSFEEGYEFDALVIDDTNLCDVKALTIEERMERYIYIGNHRNIFDRFIAGRKIYDI